LNNLTIKKITKQENCTTVDKATIVASMDKKTMMTIYRDMIRTRELDNGIEELLKRGESITQHSTRGQEATPIATIANLRKNDYVMPYHRGWGWAIGKGMNFKEIMAELINKKTGSNRGRGGPQLASWENRIMGRPGIQGAHLSIAVGIALSIKYRKTDEVVVCFFGNGSSNSGNLHESLNMASTWKVPVVFIVENNLYEIYEPITDTTSVSDIADRALGHGLEGTIIDGNDAFLVYKVVGEAIEKARRGEGPSLIETKTYRWMGHSSNDQRYYGGYRSKEEVDAWKEKCPISLMEKDLIAFGVATQAELDEIQKAAVEEKQAAVQFAIDSPYPEYEDLLTDNYADEKEGL